MAEDTNTWQPSFDQHQCREWLTLLLPDNGGYANIVSTGNWEGRVFDTDAPDYLDDALDYIAALDAQNPKGIYLRIPPLKDIPAQYKRGGTEDSKSLQCFWLDMDIAGPGHKEAPLKSGQKPRLPLPPDEKMCRKIVKHSGLPDPTMWIHSGGGLYPIWFFKQYVDLTLDSTSERWQELSQQWHTVANRAAADLGYRIDTSASDLARVLRIPGTVNRKVEGAPTQARFFHREVGGETLDTTTVPALLAERLERWPDPEPSRPAAIPAQERVAATGVEKPGDHYNRVTTPALFFSELLEPAGWSFHSQSGGITYLTRPGKNPRDGQSASLNKDGSGNLYCFSPETEFEVNEPVTPFQAYTVLHHRGDYKAAARDLGRRGFGTPLAQTTASFDAFTATFDTAPQSVSSITSATSTPAAEGATAAPPSPPIGARFRRHTLDDRGNAGRLHDRLRNIARWLPQQNVWATWTGKNWALAELGGEEMLFRAGMIMDADVLIVEEGDHWPDEPEIGSRGRETASPREKFLRHITNSRSTTRLRAALEQLKGLPGVSVTIDAFDAVPHLLNVANGVLDMRTGTLVPHAPEHLMMNLLPVAWDKDALCPQFDAFLGRSQPQEEMRNYLQRVLGYTMSGFVDEQLMFIHRGAGANGKSVLMELMAMIMGSHYQKAPSAMLLTGFGDKIPADVADTVGKRMVVMSETARGRAMNEDLMRDLTGGERVRARQLYGRFFEFMPVCKMHLVTNHMPTMTDAPATWRRIRIINWEVVIPRAEWIKNLARKLSEQEAAGILAWLVRGFQQWQVDGDLWEPEQVTAETSAERTDQDTLGDFIEETCEVGADVADSSTNINVAYRAWADRVGIRYPLSQRQLLLSLQERDGIDRVRTARYRGLKGLRVRPIQRDQWMVSRQPVHEAEEPVAPEPSGPQPALE